MSALADILEAAARLLETKGWTQHYWAVDNKGEMVDPEDRRACRFCAYGAIQRTAGSLVAARASMELESDLRAPYWTVHGWNDAPGRTKEEVVAQLRKTAARLRR